MFNSGDFSQALLVIRHMTAAIFSESHGLFFSLPLLLQMYIFPVCFNCGRPPGIIWPPAGSCKPPQSHDFYDVSQQQMCWVCLPNASFNLW